MKIYAIALSLTSVAIAAESPKGLSGVDWSSIRAAHDNAQRAVTTLPGGGYGAANPGQQWYTRFDGKGFLTEPQSKSWQWGLQLSSIRIAGSQQSISNQPQVVTDRNSLRYRWNTRVEEWFDNNAQGLEHGFTILSRPSSASGTLSVTLSVRGSLRAEGSGNDIRFVDASRNRVIDYGRLKAWDANGRTLTARMEGAGTRVTIDVDDRNARYPVTIDPLAQQAYLKASNAEADDRFGATVAISGDTVAVGAPFEASSAVGVGGNQNSGAAPNSGAVYVFTRSGTTWTQQAYVKASNTEAQDRFGSVVALSGDTLIVGAPFEDSNSAADQSNNDFGAAGAAYVFLRSAGVWSQQAYLKASNPDADDRFGAAVSISGNTAVVGAYRESSNAVGVNGNQANNDAGLAGAAYVFTRSGTVWSQQAYLKASNAEAGDQFGTSVGVDTDTIVVGAFTEDSNGTSQANNGLQDSGAAYIFFRTGTTWAQQAYLKASNPDSFTNFGDAVGVSGDTAVVGSTLGANSTVSGGGSAYVFVRSAGVWSQEALLGASNAQADDQFGWSVAIAGNTIVVGANMEDGNATGVNGADNNDALESGAAYVFTRSGTTWTQDSYLKASNTDAGDNFGTAVAVSNGTVIVGASAEGSDGTAPSNNDAGAAGAAYVFAEPVATQPPTISKQFGTATVAVGGTTTLAITITNPNGSTLSPVSFTDTLQNSLVIANPNGLVNPCSLPVTATAGAASLSLNAATLPAGACTITVNVTSAIPGNKPNSVQASSPAGTSNTAQASVLFIAPPVLSKSFGAASISTGAVTTLTISVNNPNAGSLGPVSFTDTLQNSLLIASPNGLVNACSLPVTATAGASSLSLNAATLPAGTCTITVNVTSSVASTKPNSVQATSPAGVSNTAQASLNVTAAPVAPTLSKSFGAATVAVGSVTTLSITLNNSNAAALSPVSFTDTLQNSMVIASPNGLVNACSLPVTATAGAASLSLNSASLPAGSCTITVNVTSTVAGVKPNSVQASSPAGTSNTATASVTFLAPPVLSKAFGAASIQTGAVTTLTIGLNNPNAGALSPVSFTDTLQNSLLIASPNGLVNPCSLPVTATAGAASLSLNAASLPTGLCSITVNVTSSVASTKPNSVQATSPGGNSNTATASLNVTAPTPTLPPTLTKKFGVSNIAVDGTTTMTFTLANPNASVALSGVAFSDSYPAGLTTATPNGLVSTCGAVTVPAGGTTLSVTGLSLPASASCTITVNVKGTTAGTLVNTTSAPTSTQSSAGTAASATLVVGTHEPTDAYQVRYAANLGVGDSVMNFSNTGASSSSAGIPGPQNGNICANVYTYSPDEQMVSCCSCLVTPNGLNSLSTISDLISNTLTPIRPTSVVVKVLATAGTTQASCNAALVTRAALVPGLVAWGATLHALPVAPGTPAGSYGVTETPFTLGTLSNAEVTRMKTLCGFIQANGSGYGICKSCRVGGLGADKK